MTGPGLSCPYYTGNTSVPASGLISELYRLVCIYLGEMRMPAYLKIENIGVCPPEGFTVLGVSLADTSDAKGS